MVSETQQRLTAVIEKLRAAAANVEGASKDEVAFQAATTDASRLFLDLKAANREILEEIEGVREATAEAKKRLDASRLQEQNVLYEKSHIQKEIKTCQDFRSQYSDLEIGLCSVEEFMKKAPEEAKGEKDAHAMMLKRLSHELAERKALCEQEKELKVRQKTIRKDHRHCSQDPRKKRCHFHPTHSRRFLSSVHPASCLAHVSRDWPLYNRRSVDRRR